MPFLHRILEQKETDVASAKRERNIGDLKRMIRDAPKVRSFGDALLQGFGLIAEVKKKSPSAQNMREENFRDAPAAYNQSKIVRAVSVLTDFHYFGMDVKDLLEIKSKIHQPVLRKDFIIGEYQIYEARAFGADAVLVMANLANLLGPDKVEDFYKRVYERVRELGMDALFEAHTVEEIEMIPPGAKIYGINSRKFMAKKRWFAQRVAQSKIFSRLWSWRKGKAPPDLSVTSQAFNLIKHLPPNAIKVAESGISPTDIGPMRDYGYHAVLVGTSLLKAPQGIKPMLASFERAINESSAARSSQAVTNLPVGTFSHAHS